MKLLRLLSALTLVSAVVGSQQLTLKPVPRKHLHESALLRLHHDLVDIKSTSGEEKDVGIYLIDYLKAHNFKVKIQEVDEDKTTPFQPPGDLVPERFNILAFPATPNRPKVLLTSHIDTVPPYYGYSRHGTILRGRGTVDAKACVAAQIQTVFSLPRHVQDEVALLFVVGEENGGDGMRAASATFDQEGVAFQSVIFGEPTESKLASGHKGNMGFKIRVMGKSSHSGYPWLGTSANSILVAALAEIEKLQRGKAHRLLPWSDKYGNTTINIGRIEGGSAGNVLAETAEAVVTLRIAAGTPEDVREIVEETISHAVKHVLGDDGSYTLEFTPSYGPQDISCDLDGFRCITVNYGTDIPNLRGDHKRYLYGPGSIQVAHSDHEALTVRELEQAVADYGKIVQAVLNR